MNKLFKDAQEIFKDITNFIQHIGDEDKIVLKLKTKNSTGITHPKILIQFNEEISDERILTNEVSEIVLSFIPTQVNNTIRIGMREKTNKDTVVDSDGNITKDKSIVLEGFQINNFDLLNDYDFFNNHLKYQNIDTGEIHSPMLGFWTNSDLIINFTTPWFLWYNIRSTKNSTLATELKYREANDSDLISELYESWKKLR